MNFNEFVQYQARKPVNRIVIAFKALPITYSTEDNLERISHLPRLRPSEMQAERWKKSKRLQSKSYMCTNLNGVLYRFVDGGERERQAKKYIVELRSTDWTTNVKREKDNNKREELVRRVHDMS